MIDSSNCSSAIVSLECKQLLFAAADVRLDLLVPDTKWVSVQANARELGHEAGGPAFDAQELLRYRVLSVSQRRLAAGRKSAAIVAHARGRSVKRATLKSRIHDEKRVTWASH